MDFVWLFKIRGHLCQQTIGGDAHIDRKSEFVANDIFDDMGSFHRIAVISGNRHIFCKAFINAVLADGWCIMMQQIKKLVTAYTVIMMFRRYDGQAGTFSQSVRNGFTGADAVSGSRHGFGQYNTVPFGHIAAYNGRNFSKIGVTAVPEQLDGGPA